MYVLLFEKFGKMERLDEIKLISWFFRWFFVDFIGFECILNFGFYRVYCFGFIEVLFYL